MRAAILMVLLFGLGRLAFAQDAGAQKIAEGKERFRHGTQLYDVGKYAEAASEYEAAFRLTDRPVLLFNIGQAYRLAGNRKQALASYQGFLRRVPEAPQRAEVEGLITTLEKEQREADERAGIEAQQAEAAKAAAAKTVAAQPPPPQDATGQTALVATARAKPETKKSRTPLIIGVVAGVLAAGAVVGIAVGFTQSTSSLPHSKLGEMQVHF